MTRDDDARPGFLNRWSRAKRAAEARPQTPVPDPAEEAVAALSEDAEGAAADSVTVDAEYIAQLPPLDEITVGTDLSGFLREGVPHALRNAALRKMWMADPVIRDHLDVARDYFWDWNAPGGVPGGAGKLTAQSVAGMLKDIIGAPEPKEADPAADPAVADAEAPAIAGDRTAESLNAVPDMPPPQDPVRRGPVVQATPVDAAEAPEPRVKLEQPRKRHGGALPS